MGKCMKGRDSIVLGGPTGEAAPAPLTLQGRTVQGQWSLNSLGDLCALGLRDLGPPSSPSQIVPC